MRAVPSWTSPSSTFDSPRNWASSTSPGRPYRAAGRVELGDHPVAQDRHLIGHGQRLVLVVGDQDGGRARLAQHTQDVGADRGAHRRVERGEGLVQEDDLRLDGERTGEGDPLLLPARELMGIAAAVPRQPHQLEQLVDPAAGDPDRVAGRRPRCARR